MKERIGNKLAWKRTCEFDSKMNKFPGIISPRGTFFITIVFHEVMFMRKGMGRKNECSTVTDKSYRFVRQRCTVHHSMVGSMLP
jgi:hypothetical protein